MRSTETVLEDRLEVLGRVGCVLADRVSDPLLICDRAGTVLVANAAFEDVVGESRTRYLGRRLAEIALLDAEIVRLCLEAKSPWTREVNVTAAGTAGRQTVRCTPLRWGEESKEAISVSIVSVSRFPSTVCYPLSDACAAVGRYAGKIAHDLRNPLTGISTGLQYLARLVQNDPRQKETLDAILEELRTLDGAIGRLASVERKPAPVRSEFHLGRMMQEVLTQKRPAIADKQVSLFCSIEPWMPLLPGDPERVKAALSAVVHRALDATDEGGPLRVLITVRNRSPRPSRDTAPLRSAVLEVCCKTSVRDLRAYIEALDPASPSWDEQVDLYLAGQIVQNYDGWMEMRGKPGEEIRFLIAFPLDSRTGVTY